jgi:ceramide glucosyltransferase
VALAPAVPATTVPETTYPALWRHELRWARTIRALVPAAFVASALQFPLGWALLTVLIGLFGSAPWLGAAALGYVFAFAVRAATARSVERAVRSSLPPLADPAPLWLLPVRDVLSLAVMIASYRSDVVDWRGHQLIADDGINKPSPVAAVIGTHDPEAPAAPTERRLRRLRATLKGQPTP